MANRGMSSAMLAEIAKSDVQQFILVEMEFEGDTLRMTSADHDIEFDSDTYMRTAGLLNISEIVETGPPDIESVTLQLDGVDIESEERPLYRVLNQNFLERPINIYIAFENKDTGALIVDPVLFFGGRMDQPIITENIDQGTASVSMKAFGKLSDFGTKPGIHTNDTEQQERYPGDLFFEYVTDVPVNIDWGRA
tara:strand:- start:1163 stop:1744 length:582 start_codon:yes stop_codon:yes gene_type:complete